MKERERERENNCTLNFAFAAKLLGLYWLPPLPPHPLNSTIVIWLPPPHPKVSHGLLLAKANDLFSTLIQLDFSTALTQLFKLSALFKL